MPLAASAETLKLGPPQRNSRATRLATTPPRAPKVRLAVKGGAVMSWRAAHQASTVLSSRFRKILHPPLSHLIEQRPAGMKIGGFIIEIETDDDPHPRAFGFIRQTGIGHGCGRHFQHQQVLGQNVGNFFRRNAKFGDADRQAPHETALAGQPHATVREHVVAPLPAIRGAVATMLRPLKTVS